MYTVVHYTIIKLQKQAKQLLFDTQQKVNKKIVFIIILYGILTNFYNSCGPSYGSITLLLLIVLFLLIIFMCSKEEKGE